MQSRHENRTVVAGTLRDTFGVNPGLFNPMAHGQFQYCLPGTTYHPLQKGQMLHDNVNNNLIPPAHCFPDDVTQSFGNLNVNGYGTNAPGPTNNGVANFPSNNGMQPANRGFCHLPDGRIFVNGLGIINYHQPPGATLHQQGQFLNQAPTMPSAQGLQSSPQGMMWNGTQQNQRDLSVPELAPPRRSSLSSNEEAGPHTPFFGASTQSEFQPKVALSGSPHAWTTPSPQQLSQGFYPQQLTKSPTGQYVYADLDALCMQEPVIPKPVPAIFSGEKGRGTLEKSLQNTLNTTNVYVRGLHPNTTDEMLHSYGIRFGAIISAKSMLEQDTGACKGFGFIKYHNFDDGENCIRAFFHWGYEAKWARVSHNEKLKTLGDEENTNLYVSNLPLDYNEHNLMAIFDDFEVLSAKILRDTNGMSRGVGFARFVLLKTFSFGEALLRDSSFSSPDICRQIIEHYNGKRIGDEGSTLSIRFADTPEQKKLKSVTAERRQFKTNEYNTAVYSPGSPYLGSPATNNFPSPVQTRTPMTNAYWTSQAQLATIYGGYTNTPGPYASPSAPNVAAFKNQANMENVDPNGRFNNRIKIENPETRLESPITVALSKRSVNIHTQSPVKSEGDASTGRGYGQATCTDAKSSPIKPSKYSPIKPSPVKENFIKG